MIDPKHFFELLKCEGVGFFAGVPDSLLKDFCSYIDDHVGKNNHFIAANEGGAIGLAVGYHLATRGLPVVYMQNSGLGNALNPLTSLADPAVYGIPIIIFVGWRGEPLVHDEPQHKKMGEVTIDVLKAIDIPYIILSEDWENAKNEIKSICDISRKESRPCAVVVKKNIFSSYKSDKKQNKGNVLSLTREEALSIVTSSIEPEAVIVSSTGKMSRELFEIRERQKNGHNRDFLTVGSMGHASQIALGLAVSNSNHPVYCYDGDGAVLMHLGGLAIIGQQKSARLRHIVFNNGMHESVGGQKTVAFDVDFCQIAKACGYEQVLRATNKEELEKNLSQIKNISGPIFLEIRLLSGSRDNLGRPTTTPQENKFDFISFVNK